MTRRLQVIPALIAIAVTVGCAPTKPEFRTVESTPLSADLPRGHQADANAADRAEFVEPVGDLTLRQAHAAALTSSPGLTAFSWEIRVQEAEAMQAGMRPNPDLDLSLENFGGSDDLRGFSGSETTLGLSQRFELGGKRSKRVAVAASNQRLAAWDYEAARVDVLTATSKAFVEVLVAQEQVSLAESLVEIADEALKSVERRVRAGSVSPAVRSLARVDLETARIELTQSARNLVAARKRLTAMWGTTVPAFDHAAGNIEIMPPVPGLSDLRQRISQNPDLARWMAERDHRAMSLDLEKSYGTPDVSVGAGVRHYNETDGTAFIVDFSLPLPLFDRNQGAIEAAELRLLQAEAAQHAATVRAQTQLAVVYEELKAAGSEVLSLRDYAIPAAEEAFIATDDAYRRGAMRITDSLNTKRLLFELRGRYFAALNRYHAAIADIERLTGESVLTPTNNSGSSES